MRKDLLLALADHMESADPKTYNQGHWFSTVDEEVKVDSTSRSVTDPYYAEVCLPEGFCGATACVLGHATSIPETGLKVYRAKTGGGSFIEHVDEDGRPSLDFRAAAKAFDIPFQHAEVLFGPPTWTPTERFYRGKRAQFTSDWEGVVSPQLVAKRLRAYVNDQRRMKSIVASYPHHF